MIAGEKCSAEAVREMEKVAAVDEVSALAMAMRERERER
ncbi:hypothetical protein L195_g001410, partial [Trifolium pratense]